ncbi:hypothetical protein [Caulobacter sp. CCUG 60055]|uniref:hypothetical protein n=1 Tax=Caulobacter sp. CCUG 60055 TaxID=2100090 RepID=UPI001FA6F082|nr:hypothetical protein [Caulobacter sp. CCUG 60055]
MTRHQLRFTRKYSKSLGEIRPVPHDLTTPPHGANRLFEAPDAYPQVFDLGG